ncbi:threonine ammonia-lyase [Spirillospora sp. CA-294931]|uniref:threonine ammonia-lyase n=1 Tax=Spirillospora sp. CA-294931 TaxID=3240042 RepID=UPI003D928078
MPDLVPFAEIERASRRLSGVALRTPLVSFPMPGPADGPQLLVKAESLQPIGAFKLRGAYSAIAALPKEERERGVVAHSSGNHAQAVAYTARRLGIRAVLVVPHTTPKVKVQACIAHGAEVVFVEPTMEDRIATAEKLAAAHGLALIPPFDDPRIIAGQGTIGREIVDDRPDTEVVLVPISGGGLIAGIATAVKILDPSIKVIGVEPELAADARASFRAGEPVSWRPEDTRRTIADALVAQRVGDLTFAHIREYVDDIVTVSEDEIRDAMRRLALSARLIAEPGGAVATAAFLSRRDDLPAARTYVSVLSGGNVDPALLQEVLSGG